MQIISRSYWKLRYIQRHWDYAPAGQDEVSESEDCAVSGSELSPVEDKNVMEKL